MTGQFANNSTGHFPIASAPLSGVNTINELVKKVISQFDLRILLLFSNKFSIIISVYVGGTGGGSRVMERTVML